MWCLLHDYLLGITQNYKKDRDLQGEPREEGEWGGGQEAGKKGVGTVPRLLSGNFDFMGTTKPELIKETEGYGVGFREVQKDQGKQEIKCKHRKSPVPRLGGTSPHRRGSPSHDEEKTLKKSPPKDDQKKKELTMNQKKIVTKEIAVERAQKD